MRYRVADATKSSHDNMASVSKTPAHAQMAGARVSVSVLFVGCFVAAVQNWFVCPLVGAVVYVVQCDASPMLLSLCDTSRHMMHCWSSCTISRWPRGC